MKRFSLLRALSVVSLVLSLGAVAQAQTPAPTPEAANDIFTDKGELGIEFARNDAHAQIVASEGSTTRLRYKSPREETRFYDGYFKAHSATTKLALLSDDGTSVWIDGVPILERARQNQGFQNFSRAFTELSATFAANRIYHVRLEYTNTIHQNDADMDGITLFAYDGGGEFVAPPTSTSTALSFDLLRAAGAATSTQAANYSSFGSGAIGGQVYGALYLTVGQGQRVASRTALVRLHEEADEANRVVHPASEDRIDVPVSFIERGGWQKYYDPAGDQELGWWDAPEAPSAATSSAGPVRYRFLLGWNTARETPGTRLEGERSVAGKLWGHNGAHRMSLLAVDNDGAAQVAVVSDASGAARASRPADKQAVVGNLVIRRVSTSTGTKNYFCYDPSAEDDTDLAHPTVNFTFTNDSDTSVRPRHYHWYLWARETYINSPSNFVVYEGDCGQPGEVTVNIKPRMGEPDSHTGVGNVSGWGTYAFNLTIVDNNTGISDELRSSKVSIPLQMTDRDNQLLRDEEGKTIPGHQIGEKIDDNRYSLTASYMLKSERDASEMRIDLCDGDLTLKKSILPGTEKNRAYRDVPLHTPEDDEASDVYKGIFVPTDNFKDNYRDHKDKSMLAINQVKNLDLADNYEFLTGDYYQDSPRPDQVAANNQGVIPFLSGGAGYASREKPAYRSRANGRRGFPVRKMVAGQEHFKYDSTYRGTPRLVLEATNGFQPSALLQKNMINDKIVFVDSHGFGNASPPNNDTGMVNPDPGFQFAGHFTPEVGPHTSSGWTGRHNDRTLFVSDINTHAEFVLYTACWSAKTNTTSGYGNLINETVSSGAKSCVGFLDETVIVAFGGFSTPWFDIPQNTNVRRIWTQEFWQSAMGTYGIGQTIQASLQSADLAIYQRTGNHYGYNSWFAAGDPMVTLNKARK